MANKNICKNCKHWRNQQRDLAYNTFDGFCTNGKFAFNTTDGKLVAVFDSQNVKTGNQSRSHQIETQKNQIPFGCPEPSRYCLVTTEHFGCNFFELKKEEK